MLKNKNASKNNYLNMIHPTSLNLIINDTKKNILNYTENILGDFSDEQLVFIEEKISKNFKRYLHKIVDDSEIKKNSEIIIEKLLSHFCNDYACLKTDKQIFILLNDEWENVTLDKVYENWISILSFYKNNITSIPEFMNISDVQKINLHRRIIFKKIKTKIFNTDILQKRPGKILLKKTKRIFKNLGLDSSELNYLFFFLGYCILKVKEYKHSKFSKLLTEGLEKNEKEFSKIYHVWCGYKVYDVIKTLQCLLGPNPFIRLIKHSVTQEYFTNICCINFPYEPTHRRHFLQGIRTLPIQTRMVFTDYSRQFLEHCDRNNFESFKVGSLKNYTDRTDLINCYLQKNYQKSIRDVIFLDELYDDFKNWSYNKGIPRSIVAMELFKKKILTGFDNSDNIYKNNTNLNQIPKNNSFSFDGEYIYLNFGEDTNISSSSLSSLLDTPYNRYNENTNVDKNNNLSYSEIISPPKNVNNIHNILLTTQRKKTIIFGQVSFMTRHQLFRQFSQTHLSFDSKSKTTGKSIYDVYMRWIHNNKDNVIPGHSNFRVSSFSCSRAEINEFLKIDFLISDKLNTLTTLHHNNKWCVRIKKTIYHH
jgi:hypothetical protein